MIFGIDAMEVVKHRNKPSIPCYTNWQNYDGMVIGNRISRVGCRAPYQKHTNNEHICQNHSKMKEAKFEINSNNKLDEYPPPCKSLETIHYSFADLDIDFGNEAYEETSKWIGRETNHIVVTLLRFNKRYKEITQAR